MLLQHRRAFASLIYSFDLATLCVGLYLGTPTGSQEPGFWLRLGEFALLILTWTHLAGRFGLYESRRTEPILGETLPLSQAMLYSLGAVYLLRAALGFHPGYEVAWTLMFSFLLLSGTRLVLRMALLWLRRHGRNYRSLLFIGRGRSARTLAADFQEHSNYGIKVLGGMTFTGEENLAPIPGMNHLGTTANLQHVLRDHAIDEVVLCPADGVWASEVKSVLRFCETVGLPCKVAPDFLGIPASRTRVSWIGSVPFYVFASGFQNQNLLGVKRLIDILGATLGLVLVAPLLLAIALAIKLESRGPVFFRQTRVGLNGRLFTLLKFRSMVMDAERRRGDLLARNEQKGPVFKIKDDPRVTRIGRILRRYSLDELPQLINVLIGDMSIVGPRPPLPSEVLQYDWWQRRRLSVRPGITCIWQVSGRNNIEFDRWMELDLQYIDDWSLGMDVKIMAKTVREVLRGGGH